MAHRKKMELQEPVTPNLIPMIDIMFLLLLFLMLGADMGQREFEEVMLAKAKHAEEDKATDLGRSKNRLNINIYHRYSDGPDSVSCAAYAKAQAQHNDDKQITSFCRSNMDHWLIAIRGKNYRTDKETLDGPFFKRLAWESKQDPSYKCDASTNNKPQSDRLMQIRADAGAPYELVQMVMLRAANAGLTKMEFAAGVKGKQK